MANHTTDLIMTGSSPKAVTELRALGDVENLDLNKAGNSDANDSEEEKKDEETIAPSPWPVSSMSGKARRTENPIRKIVDPIVKNIQSGAERGDGKDHISLALGDPTVGGNLPPCQVALDAVVAAALEKPHAAGYINACGLSEARQAIAEYHSYNDVQGGIVTAENVIVGSGCSGTLELVLTALLDPGTAILVPQPGFPLYQVIAESHGASVVHYRLNPDRNWGIDLAYLRNILETTTTPIRGIIVNNPSNPTGAVFSRTHLGNVIEFCDQHHLPIVADEVYGNLTFGLNEFHPLAKLAAESGNTVPVITTSGLAKQYLLPGWRCGWAVFHDNAYGSLKEVEAGAKQLAQVVLGASHLIQKIIPALLTSNSSALDTWRNNLRLTLERQAKFMHCHLSKCHGLSSIVPQGAMYSMVGIDLSRLDLSNDVDFSTKLLQEENVFVLPGSAFGCPNMFRVVFCCNEPILEAAAHRIDQFCLRHAKHT